MAEQIILCCGEKIWALTIAWLQVVLHGMVASISLLFIIVLLTIMDGTDKEIHVDNIVITKATAMAITIALEVQMLVSLTGTTFGIILLRGVNQKCLTCLRAWIAYAVMATILHSVSVGLMYRTHLNLYSAIANLTFSVAMTSFGIYVVWLVIVHINKERKAEEQGQIQGQGQDGNPIPIHNENQIQEDGSQNEDENEEEDLLDSIDTAPIIG